MIPLRLIPAALLSASAFVNAADPIDLRQQWLVGKQYQQSITTKTLSTFNIGGQEMNQKLDNTVELTTTVKTHEDGQRKRIGIRYQRVALQMDMMGQTQKFDSAKPEEDPAGIGKGAGAIVGKEIRMILGANGEVEAIENLEEVVGNPDGNPNAAMMGQMLTKDTLKDIIAQGSLKAVPPGPVTPGATWDFSNSISLPQVGSVILKGTYTFKGMADVAGIPCAEITIDATMAMDAAAKPDAPAANPMGITLVGAKMSGTTHFDPSLGIARDSRIQQKLEMEMPNPAQPGDTLRIPMTQDITVSLTGVTDAP